MNEEADCFFRECAAHARRLPLVDSVRFLRGLMLSCHDSGAVEQIRSIYNTLHESENQLDLIHSGQLKLDFSKEGKKK